LNSASLSVVPTRDGYMASGINASMRRRSRDQPPTKPLCMNSQVPQANGWQFCRVMGVPVAARTCA
jgi:hypothetical protein